MQNLLVSNDIGTVFLDRELRIKRYTPRMEELFNIIPSDIGRPLAHLTHKLHYQDLSADAARVLQNLARIEDDGIGFDPEAARDAPIAQHRLGLLGMKERLALIGGTLNVESEPGNGTTIYARIPLALIEQERKDK